MQKIFYHLCIWPPKSLAMNLSTIKSLWLVRFLKISSAHQGYIYLIRNIVKTVRLKNYYILK